MLRLLLVSLIALCLAQPAWADPKNAFTNAETPVSARCVSADGLTYESCGGTIDLSGAQIDGGTQYDQGTAATDTDTGNIQLCVRADTAAVATGVANGDRARCIVDATGRMWVHVGTIDGGTITTITNPVTVTDGSGALNVIVDSGTVAATQSGTWNVGTVTTVTGITNPVTVTDGSGALNVICDSGCSGGTQYTEDDAASGGETLTLAGTVRQDTPASSNADGDYANLKTDSVGRLWVNGSGVTQPVSGTVTVTDGSGALNTIVDSGTITTVTTVGTITNPVTVTDGSGALNVICDSGCSGGTQYAEDSAHVSGDTVTMAGVVRSDAAGALAADGDRTVLQVDGNGYLKVANQNPNLAADDSTNSTAKVPVLGAVAASSAPTWTNGRQVPLSVTTDGALRVSGGSGGTSMTDDAAFTAGTTAITPAGAMFDDTSPDSVDEGDGGVLRMSANRNLYSTIRDAAGNERGANVNASNELLVAATGTVTANAGTNLNTSALLTTSAHDAAFGTAGSADAQVRTVQGIASMTPLQVQSNSANLATETTLSSLLTALQLIDDDQTGASMHHRVSVGTTEDEHEVKGSAGRLFSISVTNTNAAARYLRCANQVAASTTPGTTTVWYGMAIPGATTGAGFTVSFGPAGAAFSTGLTCWIVTGAAENDVEEVAANEINVNYTYK